MYVYIYVLTRDYGFAPNPFYGICTLATCKPRIRKSAKIDDWVLGIGSKTTHQNRLIYLMRVTKKITYNEYWENPEYSIKKPFMKGSLKRMYGDNIYYLDPHNNSWVQSDSHHSYANGVTNYHNLNRDTKSNSVLISSEFYYFGKDAITIPEKFKDSIYKSRRGYCKETFSKIHSEFILYIKGNFEQGYNSDPILFNSFQRYNGVT